MERSGEVRASTGKKCGGPAVIGCTYRANMNITLHRDECPRHLGLEGSFSSQ